MLGKVKLAFSEISCIYLGEIEQGNIIGFFSINMLENKSFETLKLNYSI